MGNIILVKHSLPEIVSDLPARTWQLNDDGRHRAWRLADRLAEYRPRVIVSSDEPKAQETAEIVAAHLGVPTSVATALHEHERPVMPFLSEDDWLALVASFFARPSELVFGFETADAAHERFSKAVHTLLARHPDGTIVVITHGTVLTLFVARLHQLDPFQLWRSLGLPSYVVLSRPGLELVSIVDSL